MILALSFVLSLFPNVFFAPGSITATFRFDQAVKGEVCINAQAISDDAEIYFRSSCEDIDGWVRQIRWKWNWAGEYHFWATFRGGAERITLQPQLVIVKPPIGRGQ